MMYGSRRARVESSHPIHAVIHAVANRPVGHHDGIGEFGASRALWLLVDDELHTRVAARGGLAQLLLQRAQQRQRRGQADRVIVVERDALGHGAMLRFTIEILRDCRGRGFSPGGCFTFVLCYRRLNAQLDRLAQAGR